VQNCTTLLLAFPLEHKGFLFTSFNRPDTEGSQRKINDMYQDERFLRYDYNYTSAESGILKVKAHRIQVSSASTEPRPSSTRQLAHLLTPRRLQSLKRLDISTVEGIERVNQPLPISASQGLQNGVHELQKPATTALSG